ncbi:vWA domain-containing protein [Ruegeria meonggei]|uniref:VWA domain containing CoxE-like protein n=1 Tax=Ruegeria meonggei TaxID=1446476 RepID=A0A1X6Z6Z4_9RHOB|nr:VWA domain-containing protein [Ruegeria meonggei]SLN42390.1 VWA domain containing CoxE-like protein [Ruegeria meonggei]
MQVTRFPSRAAGIADRMSGFIAHLRMNGMRVGPRETGDALAAMSAVEATDAQQVRRALCAVLAGDAEDWRRFDALFDAYWFNAGKQRSGMAQTAHVRVQSAKPMIWQQQDRGIDDTQPGTDQATTPDPSDGEAEGMDGQLIATRTANLSRRDLRELMDEEALKQAEAAASKLARAIRDRRSRRRKQALRGPALDMRRIQRASLARGGEPMDLYRRARPPRPMRIVALCDVSGSMTVYSRVFLAFLKGLIGSGTEADAYLFHTRLMRVTDALRDHDSLRAAGRLSLMAEGFGGGTDISGSLNTFVNGYGTRALNGRTIVLILSDGYCSQDPQALGEVLGRIRRKARRIVWLNPLKGWRDYQPIAAAMQAAEPYLDAHLPANTLDALAALEPQFRRL